MASSDSTPDFSWLNNKESEKEEAQKSQPEDQSSESEIDESPAIDSENSNSLVNPTAETWIQESPDIPQPFIEKPVIPEGSSGSEHIQDADTDGDSVFDEDESENDSIEETLIMSGESSQTSDSDRLSSSNNQEDLTVVLPPDSDESDPIQNETFASPEPTHQDDAPVDEINSTTEELNEPTQSDNELNDMAADQSSEDSEVLSTDQSTATDGQEDESADASQSEDNKTSTGLILLISYASLMTLFVLFLLMKGGTKPVNQHLESLPDVAPEPIGELSYVPVNATLPAGHVLALGEKQRFGNILVEPIRIDQGPIEFTHYSSDSKLTRPPSEPVVKLWLKFTNVSKNQEIAPLDGNLLLRWVTSSEQQREFSNQYLFPEGASEAADEIATYRHSKTSDWDLKDQKLGFILEPGESYETYIASSEDLPDELPEKLIWRIQFRKGFSNSGNGVTTIIDVNFNKSDISSQPEAEKSASSDDLTGIS